MAGKRIKFALKMKDGVEVRTLQELKESFDLNQVVSYYLDGKLEAWLLDRYYEDLADQIKELDKSFPELGRRLCEIFEIEYQEDDISIEKIEARNQRIKKLREITDDEEIIKSVDCVAFTQEELGDLLDEGMKTIYLCGSDFHIPMSKKGVKYIGINTKLNIDKRKMEQYKSYGIEFIDLFDVEELVQKNEDLYEVFDNDVHAVFLCKGDPEKRGQENFLAYVTKDIQPYSKENELNIKYKTPLKLIKSSNILKYNSAIYDGDKIVYETSDSENHILAVMNSNGKNNRIIRHNKVWEGSSVMDYTVGKDCILARVGSPLSRITGIFDVLFRSSNISDRKTENYEIISMDGEIEKVQDIPKGEKFWSMPQGFFAVDQDNDYRDMVLVELLNGKNQIKIHTVPLPRKGKICSVYGDYDSERLYFFLNSATEYGGNREGYFYFYDIGMDKVCLAVNQKMPKLSYSSKFTVKDNKIVYRDMDDNLIVLDMISREYHILWKEIKKIMEINCFIEFVGDYLYFTKRADEQSASGWYPINKIYRIKLDGTEKTLIWDASMDNTEIDIQEIQQICCQ